MRRRTFLASAITALPVAVTGCTNLPVPGREGSAENPQVAHADRMPVAQLRMIPGDDSDIGHYFVDPPFRYEHPPERKHVITWTVENGSTTVDAEFPPVRGERPVKYDGRVYGISYEVIDERPATRYFWNLEPTDEGSDEETVKFEDLPRLDREKFRLIGLADGAYGERNPLDVGGTFKYANEDRAKSALVPTPDRPIIVWGPDRRARFSIQKTNAKNATLKTYRYMADQLAPTVAAYGRQLRERYTFELSGLSDAEREIVEQAIQKHGYTVESGGSVPDAFYSLADTFRKHEAVEDYDGGVSGKYLTRYDGQIYATRLINQDDDGTGKTSTTAE